MATNYVSHQALNYTPNYRDMIVENRAESPILSPATPTTAHSSCKSPVDAVREISVYREDDEHQHIEDCDLFPVIRDGQTIYVTWNQITPEEHRQAYVNVFLPCSWEEVY